LNSTTREEGRAMVGTVSGVHTEPLLLVGTSQTLAWAPQPSGRHSQGNAFNYCSNDSPKQTTINVSLPPLQFSS